MLDALPAVTEKGFTKAIDPLFDMDEEVKRLALLFAPIITDEVQEAAQQAMLLVTAESFDLTDPAIARFIERRTKKVSRAVNKETDKQLRAELAEGLKNGESIAELMARIEKVYGAAAGYRAERIARTETIRAETWASERAWKQSGVVEAKEWYTARDERTCQFCGPMDGRVIELGKRYYDKGDEQVGSQGGTIKFDFESIQGPPLHANCRCTLLPVLKSED